MEIVNKKIKDIIPYENNPRNNDEAVEYVKNSIEEFGFKVPIILDKDNVIIAGHTRLKASMELGLKEVPCIIADDLNEEEVMAYRLADNKVGEKSKWDFDMLLKELDGLDANVMEKFGIEDMHIDYAGDEEEEEQEEKEKEDVYYRCPNCQREILEGDLIECE